MQVWLSIVIVVVGCSSGPLWELAPDSTVTWTPDKIELQRFPSTCGQPNPPFNDLDLYGLFLYDDAGAAGTPQSSIYIAFVPTDIVNHDYPISLSPLIPENMNQQVGITAVNTTTQSNGDVNFSYEQGQALIDHPLPLADVTVRFDALPRAVGEVLVALVEIRYNDGALLSFTARPELPSVDINPCPKP